MKRRVTILGRVICYFIVPGLGAYTCYATDSLLIAALQSILLWSVSMAILDGFLRSAEGQSLVAEAELKQRELIESDRKKTQEKVNLAYSSLQSILADGFLARSADQAELSLMLADPVRKSASCNLVRHYKDLNTGTASQETYDMSEILSQMAKQKSMEKKKSSLSSYS